MKAIRPNEPERAVDTLLCLSLIEARSCERMKLLADALVEPTLKELYTSLLASEARHHQTYVDLAQAIEPEMDVRALGDKNENGPADRVDILPTKR